MANIKAIMHTFILVGAFGSSQGLASPITVNLTAQVSDVYDFGGALGGAINIGSILSASYVYDTSTSDTNLGSTVGDYWHLSAPYGITVNGGGLTFKTDPANVNFLVEIVNDHGSPATTDNYLLRSYNNLPLANGANISHIAWQLDDPSATAINSDQLPALPPELSNFQSIFGLTIEGGSLNEPFFIRAHAVSVELAAVPIPGAFWLFGSAMMILFGKRRFACRSSHVWIQDIDKVA